MFFHLLDERAISIINPQLENMNTKIRVLSLGANFAITPKEIPVDDFIAATEQICIKLNHQGQKATLKVKYQQFLKMQANQYAT